MYNLVEKFAKGGDEDLVEHFFPNILKDQAMSMFDNRTDILNN